MNAEMNDSFDNLFEVYNQNMESTEKRRNADRLAVYEQKNQEEMRYARNTNIITTVMVVVTFAAVLITGYTAVQKGKVRGEAMGATIIIFCVLCGLDAQPEPHPSQCDAQDRDHQRFHALPQQFV